MASLEISWWEKRNPPCPSLIFHIVFFSLLAFAYLWKNLVFLSPSLSHITLLFSLHKASSSLRIFYFSLSSSFIRHFKLEGREFAFKRMEISFNFFWIPWRVVLFDCLFLIFHAFATFFREDILSLKVASPFADKSFQAFDISSSKAGSCRQDLLNLNG